MTCVQMGTIEFHGWGAKIADVEKPDRLVFDLDPDEGLDFDVVPRRLELREVLADIGLVSFPMLTGGKGVHVIVPLTPEPNGRRSRTLPTASPWPSRKHIPTASPPI